MTTQYVDRSFKKLYYLNEHLYAIATDGTAWVFNEGIWLELQKLPARAYTIEAITM